ncbi:MAG TPA: dehydrogenase [Dehalococcoidia bacterium]|nr:dehydrogenase [Dehalococcoidia bacterium]
MKEMEQRLQKEARALLEQGKVDYIIGFEPGSLKFTTTPLITKDKEDVERLVINPFIVNNLSVFLTELQGRVGIVVKGCDSRSIVSLIQDNKVVREDVVIIGIPCTGLIDLSKVELVTGKDRDELDDIAWQGDKITVRFDGEEKVFPTEEVLFDNCLGCECPTPQEYDILLGEPRPAAPNLTASRKNLEKLDGMSSEERWDFWKNEFSRCIRCYACRNVCPACFCKRCFVEESEPQWVLPVPRWQDNLIFQVIRNIHVAGRCTDCGECERACPVNIPLRSLSKRMYELVDELFQFKAGMDKDAVPLMTHYELEEAEDFIR